MKSEFEAVRENYKGTDVLSYISLDEPPCKDCKNWSPRNKTDDYGFYNGIVLCIAGKMYNDFSCFEKIKQVK